MKKHFSYIRRQIKEIETYPNYYIDRYGVVYVKRLKGFKIIKSQISKNGYVRADLWKDDKGKKHLVHRLVAQAFIKNENNYPQVNHKDGVKTNNHYKNLEWTTKSKNQLHAYKIGLQVGYKKPGHKLSEEHKAKLAEGRIKYIKKLRGEV